MTYFLSLPPRPELKFAIHIFNNISVYILSIQKIRSIIPTLTPKNKKELLNPYDTRDQELSFGFEM